MKQISLPTAGFEPAPKKTRKREFLDELNVVVPWVELMSLIEPHTPKRKTGQPPLAVSTMLRIHFMQQSFGISDPAMDKSLHDMPLYREFSEMYAGVSRLPKESTILGFAI